MPKAAKKSARKTQNQPPEDPDVQESQEHSASSDLEHDAEVSLIHPWYPLHIQCTKLFQACTCPIFKAQEWIGQ